MTKLKVEHKKELKTCHQDFGRQYDKCKKYYQKKIEEMTGSEKAQVAKEHSLLEELNRVLQKSLTEKDTKIEEQKNEIDTKKKELELAQNEIKKLRGENQMLAQVRFHTRLQISFRKLDIYGFYIGDIISHMIAFGMLLLIGRVIFGKTQF